MTFIYTLRRIEYKLQPYRLYYDLAMAMLAMSVLVSIFMQSRIELTINQLYILQQTDRAVWLIFVFDYAFRLTLASDKKHFVRTNLIDLISILPFDVVFQGVRTMRLLRIIYMLRVFAYINRFYKRLSMILTMNDFHHVLWFTFSAIFGGAIAISYIEDMDIGDAFWWSFVTVTTVGYGDIAPHSLGGRMIAVFLMIVGIGFLSMLTGTIATFFITGHGKKSYHNEVLDQTIEKLKDFKNLSTEDLHNIHAVLLTLKQRELNDNQNLSEKNTERHSKAL